MNRKLERHILGLIRDKLDKEVYPEFVTHGIPGWPIVMTVYDCDYNYYTFHYFEFTDEVIENTR